jgi:hypothetical protein
MDHGCSGQPTVGLSGVQVQIEPATLDQIASGHIRVHYQSCQERVAAKCLTCLQQLWVKDNEGGLRLTFRKGQDKSDVYRGYLISAEVTKSKQTKQVVCLSCVDRLLGSTALSGDGLSITVKGRRDGRPDAAILQRHGAKTFWTQSLQLTNELITFLTGQNESTVVRKKPRLNPAEQHINRGAAQGRRARVGGVPGSTVSCHIFFLIKISTFF